MRGECIEDHHELALLLRIELFGRDPDLRGQVGLRFSRPYGTAQPLQSYGKYPPSKLGGFAMPSALRSTSQADLAKLQQGTLFELDVANR